MSTSTAIMEEGMGSGRSLLLDDTAEQVFMLIMLDVMRS